MIFFIIKKTIFLNIFFYFCKPLQTMVFSICFGPREVFSIHFQDEGTPFLPWGSCMDRLPGAWLTHGGGWGWRTGGMVYMGAGNGLPKTGNREDLEVRGFFLKGGVLWLREKKEGRRAEQVARKLLAWGKHPGMTTRPLVCFEGSILCMHALFWFCFWCLLFYLSCQCLMLCFLP